MSIKMIQPPGSSNQLVEGRSGTNYTVAADGTISAVNPNDVLNLLGAGWSLFNVQTLKININSSLPADLVSISAAAIATNRALTIAAQPAHARKLQIRQVIVTAITAGVLTLVGFDQDGNAITEVISLITAATQTLKSTNCFAKLTSATVSGLVGGGDGTLGLGVSNDFGLPTEGYIVDLAMVKATKVTWTFTGNGTAVTNITKVASDDAAASGTLDATARSFAPTTSPSATGLIDYEFNYDYGTGGQ
jgi:hypothetical protein